jgi:hypothetical protein
MKSGKSGVQGLNMPFMNFLSEDKLEGKQEKHLDFIRHFKHQTHN